MPAIMNAYRGCRITPPRPVASPPPLLSLTQKCAQKNCAEQVPTDGDGVCGKAQNQLNRDGVRRKKQMDINKILEDRGARYGKFPKHAEITQAIKAAMYYSPNWEGLPDDMKEALGMTAHKIGRILNGDPDYRDSWDDIIGYIKLVADRLGGDNG